MGSTGSAHPPVVRVSERAKPRSGLARRWSSTGPAWRSAARSPVRSACTRPPSGGTTLVSLRAASPWGTVRWWW